MIDGRPTALTLFSGGGLAALGLQQAGYRVVGGVEYDSAIAAVYADNLGPVDVTDLTGAVARYFDRWRGIDLLQVSPPCVSFSTAKTGGYETRIDVRLAGAICRAIHVIRPRVFVLENVRGYVHSAGYARITTTLRDLGYAMQASVLNAADWGVPQSRQRLILRAVAGGPVPALVPTHGRVPDWWTAPWVGWLAALDGSATGEVDLLPTLPRCGFASWQLERLERRLRPSASFLVSNSKTCYGDGLRDWNEPAITVTTGALGRVRAFLYPPQNGDGTTPLRGGAAPAYTVVDASRQPVRAFVAHGGESAPPRGRLPADAGVQAWLDQGVVVQITPRGLARFQGVPDTYRLPASGARAARIIGNGVPPALMAAIARPFVGAERA